MTDTTIDPELYERLLQAARQSAIRILTTTDFHQTWEDVAQDAVIDYVRYAETHEVRNPEGLVAVIARKKALPYRDRRERARKEADPYEDDTVEGEVPKWFERLERSLDTPASLATEAGHQESLEILQWALTQLSERDRELAERRYLAEEPQNAREIGEAMGMSREAAAKALERTRLRLAALMEPLDTIEG